MPELGTEAEGGHPSDTRIQEGGSGPRKELSIRGLEHRHTRGEPGPSQVTGSGS